MSADLDELDVDDKPSVKTRTSGSMICALIHFRAQIIVRFKLDKLAKFVCTIGVINTGKWTKTPVLITQLRSRTVNMIDMSG